MFPSVAPCPTLKSPEYPASGGLVAVSNSLTKPGFCCRKSYLRHRRSVKLNHTSAFVPGCKTGYQRAVETQFSARSLKGHLHPMKIRKAVFPVAGLGTRALPATKPMPKEMLTIVDKPLIQYVFDEPKEAAIEHFVFVTGRNKAVTEDHFDRVFELDATLEAR